MIPPIPTFSFNQKVELNVGADTYYEALIKGLHFVPLDYSVTEYFDWEYLLFRIDENGKAYEWGWFSESELKKEVLIKEVPKNKSS
jgi:hypothetical protein